MLEASLPAIFACLLHPEPVSSFFSFVPTSSALDPSTVLPQDMPVAIYAVLQVAGPAKVVWFVDADVAQVLDLDHLWYVCSPLRLNDGEPFSYSDNPFLSLVSTLSVGRAAFQSR